MRSLRLIAVVALGSLIALPGCEPIEAGDDTVAVEAGALRPGELVVALALAQESDGAADPVLVTATITNLSNHPVKLLSWLLPDADLEEPLFDLRRGGAPVAFVGPHYKRPAATSADFVLLPAGASLVRTVDLARFYDLTIAGRYEIGLDLPLKQDHGRGISAKGAGAWIDRHSPAQPEALEVTATAGTLGFSRCSTTQQVTITQAAAEAGRISDEAVAYLAGPPSATPRYTTWFGAFSSAGWNTATGHFSAIADAFASQNVVVDCNCKKKVYAYVYPNQPYNIYVCKAFWTAPLNGRDSKSGTLVHEMSHFDVTAGTDDFAYGQTACKTLAVSDPAKALDNADSHEYFAENAPFLQ